MAHCLRFNIRPTLLLFEKYDRKTSNYDLALLESDPFELTETQLKSLMFDCFEDPITPVAPPSRAPTNAYSIEAPYDPSLAAPVGPKRSVTSTAGTMAYPSIGQESS